MQAAEDVVKVDGTRVGGAYLALTDDGAVVIDTGMPGRAIQSSPSSRRCSCPAMGHRCTTRPATTLDLIVASEL